MMNRYCRSIGTRLLSALSLLPVLIIPFAGKAVADPNLPAAAASRKAPIPAARSTDATVTALTVATVTANQRSIGATIPSYFVGFSDELQDVIANTVFTPDNTSLINLLTSWLLPGIWRIGGATSDTEPAPALTQ
jgi:hypothetical protein